MREWLAVTLRELRNIFTDRRIATIMLGGPFLYILLFGGVYWHGRVNKVPMVVVDQDHSALSRDVTRAALASDGLKLAFYGESMDDWERAVKQEEAYICLLIPQGFERNVKRGRQGSVEVILDGSNTLIANVAYKSIRSVLGTYSVGAKIKRSMLSGIPKSAFKGNTSPIQAELRPLFNPTYNYSTFLLMGLACIALQQVTMLGASMALGMEGEESKRRTMLIASRDPAILLLGKFTAHALVMVPLSLIAIYLPFSAFGTAFRGNWGLVLGVTVLFVAIQVFAGFGTAGIFKSPLLCAHVLLSASVPLFILTGFTWPLFAMPAWLQHISSIVPLTHFASLVRRASLMGATYNLVQPNIILIEAWLPVSIAWAYWGVKRFLREPWE